MRRCHKYQRDHFFPSVLRVQRVRAAAETPGPQHGTVSPFIAEKDTFLCLTETWSLTAWPSLGRRGALSELKSLHALWNFSHSGSNLTRVQLKLNTLTPIICAVRIQVNTTQAIYKIFSSARSSTSSQSTFFKKKLKVGNTQTCFRTLMFFETEFILSKAFYIATPRFVQLHMGLNALPSPQRLCLGIRQHYRYNNILNKCKEGKLLWHIYHWGLYILRLK